MASIPANIVDTSNMLTDINRVLEGHLQEKFKSLLLEKRELEINMKYISNMPLIKNLNQTITKLKQENFRLNLKIKNMENKLDKYEQYGKLELEINEIQGEDKADKSSDSYKKWRIMCDKKLENNNSYGVLDDLFDTNDDVDDNDADGDDNEDDVDGDDNEDDVCDEADEEETSDDSSHENNNQGVGQDDSPTDNDDNNDEDFDKELFEISTENGTYYTDNSETGILYEHVDGKIGKKIGFLQNGKPFFS